MKEYDKIAELTNQYLTGRLYKLTMEFVNPGNLHVSISYEDDHDTFIDYDFNFHPSSQELDFIGHQCSKTLYKLNLNRDRQFEQAICKYLCNS